jgi:hypothetical protein
MNMAAAERRTKMPNTQNRTTQRKNDEVHYDMIEHIGVFGTRPETGWTREANIVSWNGGAAKVDLRDWDPGHVRMSKGITLYEDEAEKLAGFLGIRYGLMDSFPMEAKKPEKPEKETGPVVPADAAEAEEMEESAEEAGGMA